MSSRKSPATSSESLIKADRRRLAAEDGARAMVEIEQQAIAIRKNMERLRELRHAKEASGTADDPSTSLAAGVKKKSKPLKRITVR